MRETRVRATSTEFSTHWEDLGVGGELDGNAVDSVEQAL